MTILPGLLISLCCLAYSTQHCLSVALSDQREATSSNTLQIAKEGAAPSTCRDTGMHRRDWWAFLSCSFPKFSHEARQIKTGLKIHSEKRVPTMFVPSSSILSPQIKNRKAPLKFPLAKCFHSKNYGHFQDYTRLVSFSGAWDTTNTHEVCNLNRILKIGAPSQPKCNSGLLLKDIL